MSTPIIDNMPPAPAPTDTREAFSAKTFAFYAAMAAFIAQVNTALAWVATQLSAIAGHASTASSASADALAAATAAAASAGVSKWAVGTAYADGAVVWSPITYLTYRRKGAGSGGADPSANAAAWQPQNVANGTLGNVDMNTATVTGCYTFATPSNGPAGVANGTLIVTGYGALISQLVTSADTGAMYTRGATGIGSSPTWSAWRRVATSPDDPIALADGAIDCAKGTRFTETVSANRALAFANVPAGAYSCILEINHTGGTITLPAGSVWSSGNAVPLNAGKRHLLYFERALLGTAGWYVSTLSNFAP